MSEIFQTATPRERRGFTRAALAVLSILAVLIPIPIGGVLPGLTGMPATGVLGVVGSVAVASVILRKRGSTWSAVGLRRPRSILLTIPFAIGMSIAARIVLVPFVIAVYLLLHSTPNNSLFEPIRGNVGVLVLWLSISWTTAAFGEEMIFRGFVMNTIADLFRRPVLRWASAVMITSVIFGAFHIYQGWAGVILTTIVGLFMTMVYFLARRNLWASILTHGIFDTTGFLLIFANVDKMILNK